jgi:spore coat polysaccharide biosynthesis predicted glycosyltransferase SpsG
VFKYGYAWQNLCEAVRCLAGTSTIQERLIMAGQAMHVLFRSEQLPDEKLFAELRAIQDALTAKDVPSEKLIATVNQMTDDEAREWSMRIVDLAEKVTRLHAIETSGSA